MRPDVSYFYPKQQILTVGDRLLAASLEAFLIFSLLLEIMFVYVFGFIQTAPFIALSLANLILLMFHETKKYGTKKER